MYWNDLAQRESYRLVRETCPAVDRAAEDAASDIEGALNDSLTTFVEIVKTQTTSLRDALINVISERDNLQEEVNSLRSETERLENEVEKLQDRIRELEVE